MDEIPLGAVTDSMEEPMQQLVAKQMLLVHVVQLDIIVTVEIVSVHFEDHQHIVQRMIIVMLNEHILQIYDSCHQLFVL